MNDQTNTEEIPVELKQFLEGILLEANMSLVDDSLKEEMLKELFVQLDQHIASVILEKLPQEQIEAFIKLNEEQKPKEEIEAFLREHIPNITDVMSNAFAEFRELYLEGVEKSNTEQPIVSNQE